MGGRLGFRQIEGLLYGLGQPAEANVSRARPVAQPSHRPPPGPSGPFREIVGRVDVVLAARRISPADRLVLLEHYVNRVPQPGYMRRRAIRALRLQLDR